MTEAAQPEPLPGQGWLGRVLLSLSLGGLPLVLLVLRRLGRRGGILVACGCSVLFARDLAMVSAGAPARLRPLPRLLLLVEVVVSGTATLAGLWAHAKAPAPHPPAGRDGDLPYDAEDGEPRPRPGRRNPASSRSPRHSRHCGDIRPAHRSRGHLPEPGPRPKVGRGSWATGPRQRRMGLAPGGANHTGWTHWGR